MRGHEVYNLRRYRFGGADKIAFVFAVLIIDHNNDLAVLDLLDRFLRFAGASRTSGGGPAPSATSGKES